jgi:hypothetical protein
VFYYCPRKRKGLCPKWQQLFTGPFTIIRVIDKYNYMIAKSATAKPLIVHRDKLKIYCSNFVAADSGLAIGNNVAPLSQSANDQPVSQTTTAMNDHFSQRVPSRQQTIDTGDDLNATQPYNVPQSTTDMQATRPKRTIRRPTRFSDQVAVINCLRCTNPGYFFACSGVGASSITPVTWETVSLAAVEAAGRNAVNHLMSGHSASTYFNVINTYRETLGIPQEAATRLTHLTYTVAQQIFDVNGRNNRVTGCSTSLNGPAAGPSVALSAAIRRKVVLPSSAATERRVTVDPSAIAEPPSSAAPPVQSGTTSGVHFVAPSPPLPTRSSGRLLSDVAAETRERLQMEKRAADASRTVTGRPTILDDFTWSLSPAQSQPPTSFGQVMPVGPGVDPAAVPPTPPGVSSRLKPVWKKQKRSLSVRKFPIDHNLLPTADDVVMVNANDTTEHLVELELIAPPYVAPSPVGEPAGQPSTTAAAGLSHGATDPADSQFTSSPRSGETWAAVAESVAESATTIVPAWATVVSRTGQAASSSSTRRSPSRLASGEATDRPRTAARRPEDGPAVPPSTRVGSRGHRSQAAVSRRHRRESATIRERYGLDFDSYAHLTATRQAARARDRQRTPGQHDSSSDWQVVRRRPQSH